VTAYSDFDRNEDLMVWESVHVSACGKAEIVRLNTTKHLRDCCLRKCVRVAGVFLGRLCCAVCMRRDCLPVS
jgi:hypothetical protein